MYFYHSSEKVFISRYPRIGWIGQESFGLVESRNNCKKYIFNVENGGVIISSLPKELSLTQESIETVRIRANKLESKLAIMNRGYMKRSAIVQESLSNHFARLQNFGKEELLFSLLMESERWGMVQWIENLQEGTETSLQKAAWWSATWEEQTQAFD